MKVSESTGIRIRNSHVDGNSKVSFDNSVFDATHHAEVRAREFAALDVPGRAMIAGQTTTATLPSDAQVKKLAAASSRSQAVRWMRWARSTL